MNNILKLLSCFSLVFAAQVYATSVGVYQLVETEKYANNPVESSVVLFYGDGFSGSANTWNKWIPDSGAKYCGSKSRFRCMVGSMVLAYPANGEVNNWCFAGVSYTKKQIDKHNEQRFLVSAVQRSKTGDQTVEQKTSFVYDEVLGVDFMEYDGKRYGLISRAGVMSEEFIADASALLSNKDLKTLEDACESNEGVDKIIEQASKY